MSVPATLKDHPVFAGGTYGIVSAENPLVTPDKGADTHQALTDELRRMGLEHHEVDGHYGKPEKSVIIYNPTRKQMLDLGTRYGQGSVIYSQNHNPELHYTHGERLTEDGPIVHKGLSRFVPKGQEVVSWFDTVPDDFYTKMPGGAFRINFDFSGEPHEPLEKSVLDTPFGTTAPNADQSYLYNKYRDKAHEVDALIRNHGLKYRYVGDLYGKASKPGHLSIPFESNVARDIPQEVASWHKMWELAKEVVKPKVDEIYGQKPSPLKSIKTAYLAANKKRELDAKLGLRVSDDDFHRELNHVMRNAAYDTVGVKAPNQFQPHAHAPNHEAILDVVNSFRKNEIIFSPKRGSPIVPDQKSHSDSEAADILQKAIDQKIREFESELAALRKRELAKSGGAIPSHQHGGSSSASNGVDDVAYGKVNPRGANKSEESSSEESSSEDSAHDGEESSGEYSADDFDKGALTGVDAKAAKTGGVKEALQSEEKCAKCGDMHLGKACSTKKAEVVDHKGNRKTLGENPDATLPEDDKQEVAAKGSGGDVKKAKSVAGLRKSARKMNKSMVGPGGEGTVYGGGDPGLAKADSSTPPQDKTNVVNVKIQPSAAQRPPPPTGKMLPPTGETNPAKHGLKVVAGLRAAAAKRYAAKLDATKTAINQGSFGLKPTENKE